jgi:hypothetical protein
MAAATLSVLPLFLLIAVALDPLKVEASGATQAATHYEWVQFYSSVAHYIEIRSWQQHLDINLLTADPEVIRCAREARAAAIRDARREAATGDVFGPQIAALIRLQFERALRKHSYDPVLLGAIGRRATTPGELVAVNDRLPWGLAISLTPELIDALPWLPDELEYRLIGRDLIVWDAGVDLIVDILPDALPAYPLGGS